MLEARTLEDLADFNFIIEYIPGKTNIVADALLHMSAPGLEPDDAAEDLPVGLVVDGACAGP